MIDWTKPVETDEDPPRPVRVLFTDSGLAYATEVDGILWHLDINGNPRCHDTDGRPITLRNVPAKPVRHEAWVNLYGNGAMTKHHDKADAELFGVEPGRVECRHLVWNSDGSPVTSHLQNAVDQPTDRVVEIAAERDAWKLAAHAQQERADRMYEKVQELEATVLHREAYCADARAEVLRCKPVVDAAVAWKANNTVMRGPYDADLFARVHAYQSGPKKSAEEAVANGEGVFDENPQGGLTAEQIAKIKGPWRKSEPVRSCQTCRHEGESSYEHPCYACLGYDCLAASLWEPKP